MDMTQALTVFTIILANLGTVLTLYCQSDKKIDAMRVETTTILNAIQTEMKDFHGRLCAIEERNKNTKDKN